MAKQPAKGQKAASGSQKPAEEVVQASESTAAPATLVDLIPAEVHAAKAAQPAKETSIPAVQKTEKSPEASFEKPTEAAKLKASPPPAAQKSGFLPLALGGLVAGVIGFGVATFTTPQADPALATQIAEQATALSALEQRLQSLPVADLTAIETAQAQLRDNLSGLNAALADIGVRLDALEQRPAGAVTDTSAATAGVEAEMEALRAQIEAMAGAARTELEEARAAAASIEENAAAAARNAAARAALSRVQTALESGAPIGAALGDLEGAIGTAAPEALIAVQDGVPTLASLQEQFPDVARAALATARSEGVAGEETTGLGAFLRNQFDVRSTAPRDGNDADAILSRAEAAVRSGRLTEALAEISGLPEVARAEMADWLALAEARADAIAAVDILSTSIPDN